MSASASLLKGKNRRRALQALIAAPILALGIAAGSGTAYAVGGTSFSPGLIHLADGNCSISGWPHGELLCNSNTTPVGVNFPNGTQEIFGLGLNEVIWTDYGTEAHPSGWKSMGGPESLCNPARGYALFTFPNTYALNLYCEDNNSGALWLDSRGAGVSSGWGGWLDCFTCTLPAMSTAVKSIHR